MLKAKVEIMRKNTAALEDRWSARRLTALQVVKTSFLGPRPRRFPPPSPALIICFIIQRIVTLSKYGQMRLSLYIKINTVK